MGEGVLELWMHSKFGVLPEAGEEVGDFRKQSFLSRCFTFSRKELFSWWCSDLTFSMVFSMDSSLSTRCCLSWETDCSSWFRDQVRECWRLPMAR